MRFVIPTQSLQINHFVDTYAFRDEYGVNFQGKLNIEINSKEFILYEKKIRESNYFIIDSTIEMCLEEFSEYCYTILIAYGFLSGDYIQNEAYYLTSANSSFTNIEGFKYVELGDSIITNGSFNPIYSNPYAYTNDEEIISKVGKSIKVFTPALFSVLCTKIFTDKDYAYLIVLILESNGSSLIMRPAGYSVALEKITNIIAAENNGLKPIGNKQLAKKFKNKLFTVLSEFSDEISAEENESAIVILQKNIEKINNPTNREKLTKPFAIHEIDLSQRDSEAINNRNSFLHGMKIKLEKDSDEFSVVYQTSLRLHLLLNKLILKNIGYSGYIINHLKFNEEIIGAEVDEDLFELI